MTSPVVQLSGRPDELPSAVPVVVSVLRNEMLRLPYYLSYYRALGFRQFMFIDNDSDDGTREFLLQQPDVILFSAEGGFGASDFGMHWLNPLLDRFCHDRWILLADADELLVWPGSENESIQSLITRLDKSGAGALFTLLLDMYSDKPFGEVGYAPGGSFWASCPFFDGYPYEWIDAKLFPFRQIHGGVRDRIFREMRNIPFNPPTVSKVPLVRWHRGQMFALVAHGLAAPVPLAPLRGALLHFKMLDDLPEKCGIEVARAQHFASGREYWVMAQAIARAPNGSFFDPRFSVRYAGTEQLVSLGLMHERDPFGR